MIFDSEYKHNLLEVWNDSKSEQKHGVVLLSLCLKVNQIPETLDTKFLETKNTPKLHYRMTV